MKQFHSQDGATQTKRSSTAPGQLLADRIELQLLPRLMREHAADFAALRKRGLTALEKQQAASAIAEAAAQDDVEALAERIRSVLAQVSDVPALLLDVLAPAARLLGEWGDLGRLGFDVVDRGIKALERVVSMFNRDTVSHASRGWREGSILLAAMPGNQHTFGLRMIEELFTRDGWSLTTLASPRAEQIIDEASRQYFHVLGLSVGALSQPQKVTSLIAEIREESLNPALRIVVGGPSIASGTLPGETFGADLVATDGPSAVDAIRSFIAAR
jgi:MerR family transcriptional regulator, light-induced transcriptional regulator